MSLKIVSYKDLTSYTSQFKNINFTAGSNKLYKFVPRSELIKLAATNAHMSPEELNKIASKFVGSKELYVTRKELADLFASIFLYYGFTSTLEEVRNAPRKRSIDAMLDRTGPSSGLPLDSSMKSYMALKKEACRLLDQDAFLSLRSRENSVLLRNLSQPTQK